MASALLELRKQAGFKNAKDFAAAEGIAEATYTRYESNPDKIPLKSAWQLADRFDVPIDVIVGRQANAITTKHGRIQEAYDTLDPRLQNSFNDYLDYLTERNVQLRDKRMAAELRRYDAACYRLEQLFYAQQDNNGEFLVFAEPEEVRARFKQFVEKRACRGHEPNTRTSVDAIMKAYDRTHSVFDFDGLKVCCSESDDGSFDDTHAEHTFAKMPAEKESPKQTGE